MRIIQRLQIIFFEQLLITTVPIYNMHCTIVLTLSFKSASMCKNFSLGCKVQKEA